MSSALSPVLRALLTRTIDYAGTFPPAGLACSQAVGNYGEYSRSTHSWMLRWLVVSCVDLTKVPTYLDGKLSVISDFEEPRAAAMETKKIFASKKPVYCEVPIDRLTEVKECGSFAKIRTGGVTPEAIPSVEDIAGFILSCADLKLPFKATAGLHHPIRAEYALNYEPDSPRAVMHGFLNVFMAAAFAWSGDRDIVPVLSETKPAAFRFDEMARWRGRALTMHQIQYARNNFIHAFGSCSFTEPANELQKWSYL